MANPPRRRYPIGAELLQDGRVHVRVWAPARRRVEVACGQPPQRFEPLEPDGHGYFAGLLPGLGAGARYAFRLDGEAELRPDPASRFQPDGPLGFSQIVDARSFAWSDGDWRGVERVGQVLYELHVGTFTSEGTYAAAARELPALRELGVTTVELMPVAEWAGSFGWGYDGVDLWAPTRNYGSPDDLRRFVDAAHRIGLGVILDVVYNHFGPEWNFAAAFSPAYFSDRKTEWGRAINFDGRGSGPVRELFVENAGYWVEEFHLDGLRLDATQNIYDDGSAGEHILAAIARRVRAAGGGHATFLVAENEPQLGQLVRDPGRGGYGLDALWNDDFHHSARVALTGRSEAYYGDHTGRAQEIISALKWGYLYQGQWYGWQRKPRGAPALDLEASRFVLYLENHDQVANSGRGGRLAGTVAPARLRAMTALLLLAPGTPMLFQGQEWGSRRPFLYFADHGAPLAERVREGRADFLAQFPSLAALDVQASLPDPADPETFARCKLDRAERASPAGQAALALHHDLLALRREDVAFGQQRSDRMHGAVLGPNALALRFIAEDPADDRLLLLNLGRDLPLVPAPEPLLAPPAGARWRLRWSSEATRYGGEGTPSSATACDQTWRLPGGAALVLAPEGAP
jgi:maltooligosyltrehalose trehalohydrolase